ncbi:MAG: SGNH/GDSL hydrolase family protein, partial [Myxococcota bacterium]
DRRKVVICLGDSLTRGNVSFDYVEALARRLEPSGYTVLNAGINGELAWNLLQRLDEIVATEPAWVVLLVGTNDARGCEDERAGRRVARRMRLPQRPDEDFFRLNYGALLDRLSATPRLRPILLTLPPLGERAGGRIDEYLERFNQFIAEEASKRGLDCLAIGRALRERLLADPSESAPVYSARDSSRLAYRAVLGHYLLRWSWNRVSARHGMRLLTDMIHLNAVAGEIVVDQVEEWVRSHAPAEPSSSPIAKPGL